MRACNLCGGGVWTTLEQVDGTKVVRCTCGLVFITPQPDRAAIEENYSGEYYRPWEEQGATRSDIWECRMAQIETRVDRPGRLLDVGCGTGAFLQLAKERGWDTVGTEFSPYAARTASAAGLHVHAGEVWEAGLPDDAFDLVTCWHVIEHVADPGRVMSEMARLLRPGGRLVLATPNVHDYIFQAAYLLARGRRAPLYDPGERELHLFNFSAQTLRAQAASAGLEVMEIGFDRGAAAVSGKRLIDTLAFWWFRLTAIHWGMALELVARKPARDTESRRNSITIAVDIREWQPGSRTGIGRLIEEFLRVATSERQGDRFLLIGNRTTEDRVQAPNVSLLRLPERATAWWDQVTLPRTLRRAGAHVLYSPYIKAPLLASVPIVNQVHDLTFFLLAAYNRRLSERIVNGLFRVFCRLVLRRADAVLVDSATTARDVQRTLGCDPAKLRVVSLATSPAYCSEADKVQDGSALERYKLKPGYVLYVGNGSPHKNVPLLIRAHEQLSSQLRRSHPLVLAGLSDAGTVTGTSPSPAIPHHVKVLGLVPESDLPALYRGASLFAFPSSYEGFGLPVLESMSCGTPVLCSTAPALLELTDGAADHVAQWEEQAWREGLQSLLEDPERRRRLATQGRARAAAFSSKRMAGAIMRALDDVVSSKVRS